MISTQSDLKGNVFVFSELKRSVKRGIVGLRIPSAIARLREPNVVVLRYHSVLDNPAEQADSIGLGIIHSSADFSRQMEYLSRICNVVTMDQVFGFATGAIKLPRRSVAITFDDGFADNLSTAIPIMNRYGIPGTIYVMTGYVASVPWYCTLRYIFTKSRRASFTDPFDGRLRSLENPEDRRRSFLSCSRVCARTPRAEIENRISALENALDVQYRPTTPLMLDWDGVREVVRQKHTIGAHTMTHPNLAYVSAEEVRTQMACSKMTIENQIGNKIRHFSYPSPIMEPHWTAETIETCKATGYDTAVTCSSGCIRRGDSPLAIQRIFVPVLLEDFIWALENMFAGRGV